MNNNIKILQQLYGSCNLLSKNPFPWVDLSAEDDLFLDHKAETQS